MRLLVAAVAAGVTMLVLDAIWLTTMSSTYRRLLGDLILGQFRLGPAAAFYLLYVAGVIVLVVMPALESGQGLTGVGLRGAMLGLMAYGTYCLTNYATLKGYGPKLTAMDMAWGPVLTAVTAMTGVVAARAFGGAG